MERLDELVQANAQEEAVRLLPEAAIDRVSAKTLYWLGPAIEHATAHRQTLIMGAVRQREDGWRNGVVVIREGAVRWLDGRIPMPVGMWAPGINGFRAAPWKAPMVEIGGRRAGISICYEDLLPWTNLQMYWSEPDVHISLASLWFAQGLDVERDERLTAQGWAMLFGVPLVRAVNR